MSNLIWGIIGVVSLVAIYGIVFYFICEMFKSGASCDDMYGIRDYYADYHKTIDKERDVEVMVKGKGAGDIHHIKIYYNVDYLKPNIDTKK